MKSLLEGKEVLAFYLPQFHTHSKNSEMWGEGFTDWDTTYSAKPLFAKHDQPKYPGVLGKYDLKKNPQIIEEQYRYARDLGITGFSFYHYRFSNKERALDFPIKYLKNSQMSVRYMVSWVNVNWTKSWIGDHNTILHEQTYHFNDISRFASELVDYFKDDRYVKIDRKPLFYIHSPKDAPLGYLKKLIDEINKYDIQPYVVAPAVHVCSESIQICDSLMAYPPGDLPKLSSFKSLLNNSVSYILKKLNDPVAIQKALFSFANVMSYETFSESYLRYLIHNKKNDGSFIPTFLSGWDNTPRYGYRGTVLKDYNHDLLQSAVVKYLASTENNRILFIKSWNEWAEGNVLEPISC